ncbi:PHB depolymerase family esterase [uncultured Tateyamaria sp.]|uniref:alpha/beta hydrolase family esterase n=1 Tax=uncultured Tateyamaria sp. TaxID=455651 RepID=UPI002603264B|nr:PHB depolymerase family esterase [uncultured Tateyamaria sp.]
MLRALLLLCFALICTGPALACGPETQCRIGDRHYYIAFPPGYDSTTPIPAALFAHGLQGSALGIIRNPRLLAVAAEQNVALIAVKSKTDDWSIPGSPEERADRGTEELAYIDAVLADATRRFNIDPKRIVMSGASVGGMFTWYLACTRSDVFAAFVPMSGTFWDPLPRRCDKPVANIMHFHGDNDRTVPLQGRVARGKQQGSVTDAFALYSRHGRFQEPRQTRIGDMTCNIAQNRSGKLLSFCLYPGRHAFRSGNLGIALRMLKDAGHL